MSEEFYLQTPQAYPYGDDPEWDTEYDYNQFVFVSVGHATEGDVLQARNEGWGKYNGAQVTPWSDRSAESNRHFDQMAMSYLRFRSAPDNSLK